jgi:hypothetical protein
MSKFLKIWEWTNPFACERQHCPDKSSCTRRENNTCTQFSSIVQHTKFSVQYPNSCLLNLRTTNHATWGGPQRPAPGPHQPARVDLFAPQAAALLPGAVGWGPLRRAVAAVAGDADRAELGVAALVAAGPDRLGVDPCARPPARPPGPPACGDDGRSHGGGAELVARRGGPERATRRGR